MSPTKEKQKPLPSPLQRIKNPFISLHAAPRPLSFRARSKSRLTLLVVAMVLIVAVLNELRCVEYGCLSRVGFYGGEARHVGGGAVIPWAGIEAGIEIDGGFAEGETGKPEGKGKDIGGGKWIDEEHLQEKAPKGQNENVLGPVKEELEEEDLNESEYSLRADWEGDGEPPSSHPSASPAPGSKSPPSTSPDNSTELGTMDMGFLGG
ncbi:hypothetical protein BU26DRAFT_566989 [Trematosphaeria pertusa]|uniref:Uncharacterized protein n=1 Tax=Trematosphaeria pertusa TaxID=390896 RepID=A0A6A6I8N8_9PLEO|nr:uncharacterized protein BU26DRAFT_566989 [Trematosphaeria pertusa]KAF2246637.1 hypothetical protein BU26DRAFT_566989 [Trematosphaeria pertusa]